MKALILAAGLGTRLRPLTETIPKCLVPIHGKPLLGYWFDLLFPSQQIERALVNTSYLPQQVRDYVASNPWQHKIDLVHEDELLGTGGTILANRAYFADQPFLVAHGDNLTRFDVGAFIERHAKRPIGTELTMMTFDTDSPRTCGIIDQDERGVVTGFFEKVENPPGTRANAAVYILEPSVIKFMAGLGRSFVDLSNDVIPNFMGRICTFHNDDYHRDIGNLQSLKQAHEDY